MRRKTFDALMTVGGLVLAVVLLVAGGMLVWAHNFVSDQVHTQLAAQKIFFPEKGSEAINDPAIKPFIEKYAGEQLVNGAQAQAYADHYIAVHIAGIAGGKTYSQLSEESRANPDNQELAGQVQTVFRGETLRGLLLNAYAFWKMGQIALYAAVAAFAASGLLFILALLGLVHARRIGPEQELGHVRDGEPARTG